MRVLFINPETRFNARSVAIPLGLIAIATYLKQKGHEVLLIDKTVSKVDLISEVDRFKPDVVGISVIGHKLLPDSVKISKKLKKRGITVAWGGPLASCLSDRILENGYADYVFTGEGELVWEEFLRALESDDELSTIDGISYIKDGKIHYNGQHKLADLSKLPVMDFTFVNPSDYFQETFGCKRMLHVCSAKGCPNHCTFCYNKDFNLSQYRKRPISQVMEEIHYLVENHSMDGVYFTDELWANSREEMLEYCAAFKKSGLNFVWGCQTTVGRFTKEDYRLMYDCGCRWIFFGIESGSRDLLKKLGKTIDFDAIESTFEYCNEAGINSIAAFILGLPQETEDDLKATVELANRIKATYYSVNFFYPVPKSALCKKMEAEMGFRLPEETKDLFKQRPVEKLQKNISKINPRELRVVRSYYMWQSFIGSNAKPAENQSKLFFAKKTIIEAFKSMFNHGLVNFFVQAFYSGREFLTAVFYTFCFPSIRRKYGLYKNRD